VSVDDRNKRLRIALVGYGKMGHVIESLAAAANCEVALRLDEFNNAGRAGMTPEAFAGVDVAIEFSTPATVVGNVERLCELGVPAVVGTTGWYERIDEVRALVEKSKAGVIYGANFSVGVNAFYRVVEAAARAFAHAEDYDCWGYEAHHKFKKDAPSGTMLRLLEVMRQSGYERPIDVATNRVGHIPGTHEFGFDSEADTIRISHTARGRSGFALGALRAARWISSRQGFHEFSQVWDQMI
jgi:4-hydroxy-tetrahydrodipicolinate reductase